MKRTRLARLALTLCAAASLVAARAAAPSAAGAPGAGVVLRSALLSVTVSAARGTLALEITRNANHEPVTGRHALTATLGGRPAAVTARSDGTYLISTHGVAAGAQPLTLIVRHDGIHELLSGTVTLPKSSIGLDSLEGHGMAAWWVLNVVVILIAVIAIARRRS
jgi:hypothetical protein